MKLKGFGTLAKKIIAAIFFATAISAVAVGCAGKEKGLAGVTVRSAEEFLDALKNKEAVVYAEDLTFAEDTKIQLNYDLTIVGSGGKSTFRNVCFDVVGPNTAGEKISVAIENVVFDGGYRGALPEEGDKSFEEIFGGEREDKRCINADLGYADLKLKGCEITGYAAAEGSAIHFGNKYRDEAMSFTLENCAFYGNIARFGTVKVYNDKLTTRISGSRFYENTVGAAGGFVVSNGKATVEDCVIENNIYYPFEDLGYEERGGGVYFGGVDVEMKDCAIRNNETVRGGGLAVCSAFSGNGTVLIRNSRIENNRAKYGGAAFIDSLQGQPIDFIGCEFYGNAATDEGSILYTLPYAYWTKKYNGGQVNLLFCSAANNTAKDKGTFGFYNADGLVGYIILRGCLILDEADYASDGNYNYIETTKTALDEGTVASVNIQYSESLKAVKGSAADMTVPAEIYGGWHKLFAGATEDIAIGGYRYPQNEEKRGNYAIIIIVVVSAALIVSAVLLILKLRKKPPESRVIEQIEPSEEDGTAPSSVTSEAERIALLTERQRMIIKLTLEGKTREEIATILRFSVGTIKFDLTDIYRKLGCSSRTDLIIRYKDFF